mmetsp:Transcript_96100/g.276762  ORF Transcript_96100/g.276762 Transcript_96100/m.276762 type:complete len:81 (+) Transcript_96100:747-989(+)
MSCARVRAFGMFLSINIVAEVAFGSTLSKAVREGAVGVEAVAAGTTGDAKGPVGNMPKGVGITPMPNGEKAPTDGDIIAA